MARITTEKRLALARLRLAREQQKVAELEAKAAREDSLGLGKITRFEAPVAAKQLKFLMVDDIIEACYVRQFGGNLYIPMRVIEDYGESFAAQCLIGHELPEGGEFKAFLKCMKNLTWR